MLGRVRLNSAQNGRIAWLVAGGALAAILTLPGPAVAQSDGPPPRARIDQNRATPGGGLRNTQENRPTRPKTDLIDLRDADTASIMVVAPAPAPAGADPLAVNAVVCLAGCDRGPGTVVYRDRPMPTLASLTAPVPADPVKAPLATVSAEAASQASPLTCLAGCYEPPPRRTVASLRAQVAKASPHVIQRTPRSIAAAPIATDVTSQTETAPAETTPSTQKPAKLRSAFAADGLRKATRMTKAKVRARTAAKRAPQYGKVVPVPPEKRAATPEPKATTAAPEATSDGGAPTPAPAATTFAPQRKTETKKPEKTKPQTTVSNDWFNRINRQRKQDEAQKPDQQ
jgi:hypothetical protein